MKILSMTATFGKLEHQTLRLQPGLNILHGPNEWGKSTWCAFIATMFYGLDTREKTTKTNLAAKERYAPWSGSPMAGRMELCWQGRGITIERWTKGRTPMGEFRAYETESGLAVPELTGANCGQILLGVEKSVFLRAGFLRLADLPVTEDESLRRRLNALVTTGDESNAGDLLAQKLKNLKNKCRSNSANGLIPQAEAEKAALEGRLTELRNLQTQSADLQQRRQHLLQQRTDLENHRQALQYASAQANLHRVEQAHIAAETAAANLARLEDEVASLPPRDETVALLHRHTAAQQNMAAALQEFQQLPPEPIAPQLSQHIAHLTPAQALQAARTDARNAQALENQTTAGSKWRLLAIALLALAAAGFVAGLALQKLALGGIAALILALAAAATLGVHSLQKKKLRSQLEAIYRRYPYPDPGRWVEEAEFYAESLEQYQRSREEYTLRRSQAQQRIDTAEQTMEALLGQLDSQAFLLQCNHRIARHDALAEARREHRQAAAHAEALRAMIRPVEKPAREDTLPYSESETAQLLSETELQLQQLDLRLGQYQGRMDALGSMAGMEAALATVEGRLRQLRLTYTALELALHTLEDATATLQRRFAPRIAQSAQEIFCHITDGRYDRLMLQQDLSIQAAAGEDVALRSAQWRSEGTVDQLYFALRLAVARELTPAAPMILDDALVRFDDTRHSLAMQQLRREAESRQILLFTCQSREQSSP